MDSINKQFRRCKVNARKEKEKAYKTGDLQTFLQESLRETACKIGEQNSRL